MFEAIKDVSSRVPVALTSSGTPVLGVTVGQVLVAVTKADGTAVAVIPVAFDEVTTGAFASTGTYWLTLPASSFSVVGPLLYVVKPNGGPTFDPYKGSIKVTSGDTNAIYAQTTLIAKVQANKWQIHISGPNANKMIIYDDDDVTPFLTFNLQNAIEEPTSINPFIRIPV